MTLTDLPNVGPKLAENLRRVGLETPEAFRAAGAREAFLRIRTQVDPTACFHKLTALAGAELGVPKKEIPAEEKKALRAFFDSL
nr:TfoX/Sxy family DNA transformation protein [uncultured Oscillibacter sp.]